jgi:hypothetical protein
VSDHHKGYMTGLIIMLTFTVVVVEFSLQFSRQVTWNVSLIGRLAELRRKFV